MISISFEKVVKQVVNIVKQNGPKSAKTNLIFISTGGIKINVFWGFGVNLLHYVHGLLHQVEKQAGSSLKALNLHAFNTFSGEYMNDFEGYRFVIEKINFARQTAKAGGEANGERRKSGSPFSPNVHQAVL